METNKYYKPSLEEFHIGFELEIKTHELRPWEKHTWLPGDQAKSVSNYLDQIRVKYLDSEDIESLGFNANLQCPWENRFLLGDDYFKSILYELGGLDKGKIIYFIYKEKATENKYHIHYYDKENGSTPLPLFVGKLKNKSELCKLLTQLGIC